MGKRFGRNQRRRMRQQIEAQEIRLAAFGDHQRYTKKLLAEYDAEIRNTRMVLRDAEAALTNARNLLGPYIGFPPAAIADPRRDGRDSFQYPIKPVMRSPTSPVHLGDVKAMTEILAAETAQMRVMYAKAVPDPIRKQIHLRIDMGDDAAAYAISDRALLDAPKDHILRLLTAEIAPMLARILLAGIRAKAKR